jgi:hypothetical protein
MNLSHLTPSSICPRLQLLRIDITNVDESSRRAKQECIRWKQTACLTVRKTGLLFLFPTRTNRYVRSDVVSFQTATNSIKQNTSCVQSLSLTEDSTVAGPRRIGVIAGVDLRLAALVPVMVPASPISFASYRWQKHCRGLYQRRRLQRDFMNSQRTGATPVPSQSVLVTGLKKPLDRCNCLFVRFAR